MTEYYTMKECFDECGEDDVPFNLECKFNHTESTQMPRKAFYENYKFLFSVEEILSDKWQIKRAEPEIFTDNQWMNEEYGNDYNIQDYNSADMRWAFNGGEENGQLKEWLRPAQVNLRKTVEELIEKLSSSDLCFSPVVIDDWKHALNDVLNNLKPPA